MTCEKILVDNFPRSFFLDVFLLLTGKFLASPVTAKKVFTGSNYTSPNEARNLPVRSKKTSRKKERRKLSTSIFSHVITIVINLENDLHNNMNVRKMEVAPCAPAKPLVLVSGASPAAACCSHTGATPPTAPHRPPSRRNQIAEELEYWRYRWMWAGK